MIMISWYHCLFIQNFMASSDAHYIVHYPQAASFQNNRLSASGLGGPFFGECYPTHKKCPLLHLVIYECLSWCLSSPCDLLWIIYFLEYSQNAEPDSATTAQWFYNWQSFAKFWLEKYDFDIYKGFLQRKWPAFTRFPKKQRKGNCQISTTRFQTVAKI